MDNCLSVLEEKQLIIYERVRCRFQGVVNLTAGSLDSEDDVFGQSVGEKDVSLPSDSGIPFLL